MDVIQDPIKARLAELLKPIEALAVAHPQRGRDLARSLLAYAMGAILAVGLDLDEVCRQLVPVARRAHEDRRARGGRLL